MLRSIGFPELLLILAIGALYFLPSILGRHKRNAAAIFALNLFLGWTVLGWVGALVWALTTEGASGAHCPRCGGVVNPSGQFCVGCGHKLA